MLACTDNNSHWTTALSIKNSFFQTNLQRIAFSAIPYYLYSILPLPSPNPQSHAHLLHTRTHTPLPIRTQNKNKRKPNTAIPYILSFYLDFSTRKVKKEKKKKKTILMGTEGSSVEISEPLLVEETQKIRAVEDTDHHQIPEWKDQITIRGLAVSAVLGSLFCIITHKLNLTVGIIPSLNVAAGLLGFFFVKSWTSFLSKLGFHVKPFTRQENTVIQTCVVACYGLAFSGIYPLSNSALRFNRPHIYLFMV